MATNRTSLRFILGAGLALAFFVAEEGLAQRADTGIMSRDTVLSNGLEVIAVRNPVVPVVTVVIAFRDGAFTQMKEYEEGLPHLMEHMLFKGFPRSDWNSRVVDLDGASNGMTGVETVSYYIVGPPDNLDKAVKLLSRFVRRPNFRRADLQSERRVVVSELERRASDPFFLLDLQTEKVLFGPAFRQKNIPGNVPTILAADTRALEAHHERYYVPNNAALIVTGDLSIDEVFKAAREHLDGWDREVDPFEGVTHPPVPPLQRDTVFVARADAPDVTLSVAWQGPSLKDDREGVVAADLFSEMVTQRVSGAYSRLVDSGLFQSLSVSSTPSNFVGSITLVARTTPEKVAEASTALSRELSNMAIPYYFTVDDLEMARTSRNVEAAFEKERATGHALELARAWSLGGVGHYARTLEEEAALDLDGVRRFLTRYIVAKPRALTMMVSPSTIEAHEAALVTALNRLLAR